MTNTLPQAEATMNRFGNWANRVGQTLNTPAATIPVGIMLQDIFRMDRASMIQELKALSELESISISDPCLDRMSNSKLRQMLVAARYRYRQKSNG